MDWSLFFGLVGTVIGLVSFTWQVVRELIDWRRRPRLTINKFDKARDIRVFRFPRGFRRKFVTLHVTNSGRMLATRAVATLEILQYPDEFVSNERSFALHWAGVKYRRLTSGAEPVDIGSEGRRLDIAFTEDENSIAAGSWVAFPLSLSDPRKHQGYLPPGEYLLRIRVSFAGGKASEYDLRLFSPAGWLGIDADSVTA